MRGDRCLFAKDAPEVEIRGGLVFIQPIDGHCEIATSPATLAEFVAKANRVLDQFYEHRRAGVTPIRAA